MKLALLCLSLLAAASFSSCSTPSTVTATVGQNSVSVTTGGRIGGREGLLAQSGDLKVAAYVNNDDSFTELNKTVRVGLWTRFLTNLSGDWSSTYENTTNERTAADLGKALSKEETARAAIDSETAIQTFVP